MALRENEERYRALVENAHLRRSSCSTSTKTVSSTANDNACTLFNLSRAQADDRRSRGTSAPKMQPDGTPSFGVRRGHIDKRARTASIRSFEWLHKELGRQRAALRGALQSTASTAAVG